MGGLTVPASTQVFLPKRQPLNVRPYQLYSAVSTSSPAHLYFPFSAPILKLYSAGRIASLPVAADNSRIKIRCNGSTSSGGPNSGENESKVVLDAFFLGKAVAEAFTERVESAVGEILSTVGRLQAEQQKQVQEFQEEVLARAKIAQEEAAREAIGERGRLIVNPDSATTSPSTVNYSASTPADDSLDQAAAAMSSSAVDGTTPAESRIKDEEERFTSDGSGDAEPGAAPTVQ